MAEALRTLREAKGVSQEKLAIQAGVHRTMVGAYERAERKIYLSTAKLFLRVLGYTWTDLGRELDKQDPIARPRRDERKRR
jgi:transcriptional regulator with XRE-family HTH domain